MSTVNYSQVGPPDEQATCLAAPSPQSYPLRVAYDAQAFLAPNLGTGKGVQLRNLLGNYANTFVGFATPGHNYSNQIVVHGGLPKYGVWQQFSLPGLLRRWKADIFLAPYNTAPLVVPRRTKLILVLHDLILLEPLPKTDVWQRLNNEFRRFLIPQAVSRAHVVLTVSEHSRQQILERFPFARVQVIPCSIDRSWFAGQNARKLEERENYILAVTGNVAHKNPQRALEGYAAFVAQSDRATVPHFRLVGVSASAQDFQRRAAALKIADLVHIEPYLSEIQLQQLYRRARAVLVPSLMEGFGIPVLEAMASGTPVIASNVTSLPEVGGPAAAYFDPTNVPAIAATLKDVLGDRDRQQQMMELGLTQANRFHPDAVAVKVEEFWDQLATSTVTA